MAGAALCVPIRWPDPYFCLLGHGRPPLQGVLSIPWILRSFVFFARETSAEFRCRAGLERGGAAGSGAAPCRAEPSRASCPGPRPRIGLPGPAPAAGWPRGRGVAAAPPRRLPAAQPGDAGAAAAAAAAALRPGIGGRRAGGGGSGGEEDGEERAPGPEGRGEGGEARRGADVKECACSPPGPPAWGDSRHCRGRRLDLATHRTEGGKIK